MKKALFIFPLILFFIFVSCSSLPEELPPPKPVVPSVPAQPATYDLNLEEDPHLNTAAEDQLTLLADEKIGAIDEINEIEEAVKIAAADEQPAQSANYDFGINFPTDEEIAEYIEFAQTLDPAEEAAPVAQAPPAVPSVPPAVTPSVPSAAPPPAAAEEIIGTAQENPPLEEAAQETAVETPREVYRPNFLSGPAYTPDSLTQMGLTPLDRELIYSRIINAAVGQIVEIPFRGTGWIYLGELASKRGVVYSSRRSDPEGQSFIFTLEQAGTYTLRFYRQDFIRDYIINDHVQIIAVEAPAGTAEWQNQSRERSRVVAQPRWPSAVEEAQIRSGTRVPREPSVTTSEALKRDTAPVQESSRNGASQETQSARPSAAQSAPTVQQPAQPAPATQQPAVQSARAPAAQQPAAQPAPAATNQQSSAQPVPATQQPSPRIAPSDDAASAAGMPQNPSAEGWIPAARELLPYDETIKKAKENFDAGNAAAAINLLEQLMGNYSGAPDGSDEIYWQLGQYYEANTPSRNILLSVDYYRRLVNEYPQSSRYNDARRRIAYLERFYINIQ